MPQGPDGPRDTHQFQTHVDTDKREMVRALSVDRIGGELYESVGVEAPILLSYTHKNEWNTHGGPLTPCL